jgi:hypothetical protein
MPRATVQECLDAGMIICEAEVRSVQAKQDKEVTDDRTGRARTWHQRNVGLELGTGGKQVVLQIEGDDAEEKDALLAQMPKGSRIRVSVRKIRSEKGHMTIHAGVMEIEVLKSAAGSVPIK